MRRCAFLCAALVTAMLVAVGVRAAIIPSCSTTISSCGCIINSADVFITSGALASGSSNVDCIDINASGAVLIVAGNITGPGGVVTADGIHIMSGASNVFISGNATPANPVTRSEVIGFATGIQVDGSNAEIDHLDAIGNVTNGVVFNNVTDSDYDIAIASSNAGGDGILINGGSGNIVSDAEFGLNKNGVEISGSSNNRIFDSSGDANQGYGFWIEQSSGNTAKDSETGNNTGTGTYLGCFSTGGPSGKKCGAGTKPSRLNRIIASGGNKNGGAGLGVDLGDSANVLDLNGGSSNGTTDAVDKNKKCDHNIWMGSSFGTTSATCIH